MRNIATIIIFSLFFIAAQAQEAPLEAGFRGDSHPRLLLTKQGVAEIRNSLSEENLFTKTLSDKMEELEITVSQPVVVPFPIDAGGGYTHEQHKKNYTDMYNAGIFYQIYKDEKYARFVKNMLTEYAKMYPGLPLHPVVKSEYRGRLYWQALNECMWLVYVSQAYDCVYDYLSAADRQNFEQNIFYPMTKFFIEEHAETFNKMHNHGTWMVAAVGMIGYVMNDMELVNKALYGYGENKGGFIKQMGELFSPDGYFVEGPYYQRYALLPFIVFGQSIQHNQPELKIFEQQNGVLEKTITTLLQLIYTDGQIFFLNDALVKTWLSAELVFGVNIVYNLTKDARLLSIAKEQNNVILADAGLATAKAIAEEKTKAFEFVPVLLRDGAKGDQGAVSVFRMGTNDDQTCLVMKATSHGLSHGHYDKLAFCYFDNGRQIIQDYGAARFLNIEAKNGGHYLPENKTFAMQTIAHNTVTVDETSHFDGEIDISEKYAPTLCYFDATENAQFVSARDTNATPGVAMQRSMLMLKTPLLEKPVVIDIFRLNSDSLHTYDYPFYYLGQLVGTNFNYIANTQMREPFGAKYGYQHLWVEAQGNPVGNTAALTWQNGNRFYTTTTLVNPDTELYLNRIGANDPNFNLRSEPCYLIREKNKGNHTFVSTIEAHGDYNLILEYTKNAKSSIKNISLLFDNEDHTIVEIETEKGKFVVCMSNNNFDPEAQHEVAWFKWKGVYGIGLYKVIIDK